MLRLSLLLCFVLPGVVFATNLYHQRPTIQLGRYYQYKQQPGEQWPRAHSSDESNDENQQQWFQPQMEFVKEIQFNRGQQRPEQMYRQTKETEIRKIMKKIQRNNGDTWSGMWVITPQQQQQPTTYDDAAQSLKKIDDDEKAAFHSAVMAATTDDEDTQLNATELLKKYQYPAEELSVKTEDGYYLTVIRIPAQQDNNKNKVAFLMHGLLGSADDWLVMGPGKSLAYLLADAGYDVYLGNARGNKYSRRHASKHPATPDFWQFSNDEIAQQDLPAMIDVALQTSQQSQLYYIGHSQGVTDLLALVSTQPQYNDKIKMVVALAPLAYMSHAQSPFIKMLANNDDGSVLEHGQFQPQTQTLWTAGGEICKNAIGCNKVCSNPLFAIAGVNGEQLQASSVPVILAHADRTSSRVMRQLAQWMTSGSFVWYDYGAEVNEQVYGQQTPPAYELSAVRVPVVMYYGQHDLLAQPADVEMLQRQLPAVIESNMVPDEYFSHTDYVYSKNAPDYIYKRVINTMENN